MSFGFSVGDIILLSQLAYNLYSSVSSGRKAASRDLKELEDVLFSLKCALDHLGQVSSDVLALPDRHGGTKFKEKLDAMIKACASTLQELESMTEKYRSIESRAAGDATASKGKTKLRTLDDVKKSIQVNWHRVRWDYEKQSLQQYREKLKSHTDAINLILTSMIWANSAFADEKSRQSHDKTHGLLEEVLKKPEADDSLRSIVEDIRNILTRPDPSVRDVTHTAPAPAGPSSNLPLIATYSMSSSPISKSSSAIASHVRRLPSVGMSANSALSIRSSGEPARRGMFTTRSTETSFQKRQDMLQVQNEASGITGHRELSSETTDLNARRRAWSAQEYEAFRQRHSAPKKVKKPSFLTPATPTIQELHDCIPFIFASLPEGKQQTGELKSEIERWTQGLSLLVKDTTSDAEYDVGLLELLKTLNHAVESSVKSTRQLFYEVSGTAGLLTTLDQVLETSKSVRVMKEIEDFQDAKEEWEEGRNGNSI